jgi:hypothetical protein
VCFFFTAFVSFLDWISAFQKRGGKAYLLVPAEPTRLTMQSLSRIPALPTSPAGQDRGEVEDFLFWSDIASWFL